MGEYNLYDIDKCKEALCKIAQINTTVRTKVEHKSKLFEIKDFIDKKLYDLHTIIFDSDNCTYFCSYYKAVIDAYKFTTKAWLDYLLKSSIQYLKNEVNSFIRTEWQTIDGTLVKHLTKSGYWVEPATLT